MKPIRIFRHVACEGPGYLGSFLDARAVPYEVVCIDEGVTVPAQLDDVSGLVLMGGAGSVNEPLSWIVQEIDLIRRAVDGQVPVMGICLGGQLISKALGGEVTRGASMEVGWHQVQRVPAPNADTWLDGLPERIEAFHWHAWTFSNPPGATPLMCSGCFFNQAFVYGSAFAMQFHLEMTAPMVRQWMELYAGDLEGDPRCVQDAAAVTANLVNRIAALHRHADQVYGAWLELVHTQSA